MEGMVVPWNGGRIDAKVQGAECVNGLFGFDVAVEYVRNVRRCNAKLLNMQVKGRFVVQGGEVVQVSCESDCLRAASPFPLDKWA